MSQDKYSAHKHFAPFHRHCSLAWNRRITYNHNTINIYKRQTAISSTLRGICNLNLRKQLQSTMCTCTTSGNISLICFGLTMHFNLLIFLQNLVSILLIQCCTGFSRILRKKDLHRRQLACHRLDLE